MEPAAKAAEDNGASGASDIDGKAARVAAVTQPKGEAGLSKRAGSRANQRAECGIGNGEWRTRKRRTGVRG